MAKLLLCLALAAAGGCTGWFAVPKLAELLVARAQARAKADGAAAPGKNGGIRALSGEFEPEETSPMMTKGAAIHAPASEPGNGDGAAICLPAEDAARPVGAALAGAAASPASVDSGLCAASFVQAKRKSRGRFACAALTAFWSVAAALLPVAAAAAAALWLCGLAVLVAAVCDLDSRLIPWESCVAIAASGFFVQAIVFGAEGVACGFASALVVFAVCCAAEALLGSRGERAVGGGDLRCMTALSLASGQAAFAGLAASCAAAAVYGFVGVLARRRSLKDGVPMAPFFLLWVACIALSCAL